MKDKREQAWRASVKRQYKHRPVDLSYNQYIAGTFTYLYQQKCIHLRSKNWFWYRFSLKSIAQIRKYQAVNMRNGN